MPSFAEQMVDQACRTAQRWEIAGWSIADQPHLVAQELLLDDIWKGDDPLGRQYSGMAVALPDLRLDDVDQPDGEALTFRTELRLSRLGNHYLRLECELIEAGPQQMYTAMLRAAPEFGDLVQLGTPLRPAEAGTPLPADEAETPLPADEAETPLPDAGAGEATAPGAASPTSPPR